MPKLLLATTAKRRLVILVIVQAGFAVHRPGVTVLNSDTAKHGHWAQPHPIWWVHTPVSLLLCRFGVHTLLYVYCVLGLC